MTTLKQAFLEKYPKNGRICEMYEEAIGASMDWNTLTKANLAKVVSYLQDRVAASSVRQYCAKMKAVINLYSDQIDLPNGWGKILSIKDDESQHVYLTEDEIKRIIAYRPDSLTEATVQQQFVLGCLTGARHSDYSRFTEANVTATGNLVYVSQKTHVKAELPLSPVARQILFATGTPFAQAYKREIDDHDFNDTIREICRLCDIDDKVQLYRRGEFWSGHKYEAISSHTSRRSFCTNLYLRCRDLLLVSKLAGHSSTTMTERYICCSMEAMTENAMNYFKSF